MDAYLIGKCETFAHWFQRWTGRTNFWLYGLCCWATSGCIVGDLVATLSGKDVPILAIGPLPHRSVRFLAFIVIVLYAWQGTFRWKVLEERGYARLLRGIGNPEKHSPSDRVLRRFFAGIYIGLVVGDLLTQPSIELPILAMVAQGFFRACDPLPPCTGKLFERTPDLVEAECRF